MEPEEFKIRIDGSAAYVTDLPDEEGVYPGWFKHSGQAIEVRWNESREEWEQAA